MSFLAVDVGNTRLKWSLYPSATVGAEPIATGAEFLENIDKLADGEWAGLPAPESMLGCCVAGDAIKRRVEEQMEELWVVPTITTTMGRLAPSASMRWRAPIMPTQRSAPSRVGWS